MSQESANRCPKCGSLIGKVQYIKVIGFELDPNAIEEIWCEDCANTDLGDEPRDLKAEKEQIERDKQNGKNSSQILP